MHNPSFGIVGDDRFPRPMWCVLHAHLRADLEGLVNPFQNALPRHLQGSCDLADSLEGMITPSDLRALDIGEKASTRPRLVLTDEEKHHLPKNRLKHQLDREPR